MLIVAARGITQQVLEANCRSQGCEVSCVENPRKLRAIVEEAGPDLILIGVEPKGLSMEVGVELCGDLKALAASRHTPLLLGATDYPSARLVARTLMAGADDVLSLAPSRLPELKARIRVALRNKRYRDSLTRAAGESFRADSRSGSATRVTRRSFEQRMRALFETGQRFGLLCVEVDNFESLGDTSERAVKAKVLNAVADKLQEGARGNDLVCRLGDATFALLVLGATGQIAHSVAERHRKAIAALEVSSSPDAPQLSISVGVAAHDVSKPFDSVEALQRRADIALHDSKLAGQNRVTIARRDSIVPPAPSPDRPTLVAIPHGNSRNTIPATPRSRIGHRLES